IRSRRPEITARSRGAIDQASVSCDASIWLETTSAMMPFSLFTQRMTPESVHRANAIRLKSLDALIHANTAGRQ
ncbi:MAG: hypothetical protein ABI650_06065, partial [Dokdonella sp.]